MLEPHLGFTLLSRHALKRAEAHLREQTQGVRDEIGFLNIHAGYANRFFPGTSVLHTRLRYALFVPWLYQDLLKRAASVGDPARWVEEEEVRLCRRLPMEQGAGNIGSRSRNHKTSQPPATIYWGALAAWGILREGLDGSVPARSQVHRAVRAWDGLLRIQDADGTPVVDAEALFVALPEPPSEWTTNHGLTFVLERTEREFLRAQLTSVKRPNSKKDSLLARLAASSSALPDHPWGDSVLNIAGKADRRALENARCAAALGAIGRAVYAASVEELRAADAERSTDSTHRDRLDAILSEHKQAANELDVERMVEECGGLDEDLVALCEATRKWLGSPTRRAMKRGLLPRYRAIEEARKGRRARLADTLKGRERRSLWQPSDHPYPQPLHYRWGNVCRLLNDLRGEA